MVKQELLQNLAGTLTLKKYIDNIQIVPTSATITITDAAGDELPTPVTAAAMSIDSYGTMTYSMITANTGVLGENFKAVVTYVYNGNSYVQDFLFDVVISTLESIITDDDLINDYAKLRQLYYNIHGEITDVGNINQIIDKKTFNDQLNYYVGGNVVILSGSNQDFISDISAFNESTRIITLSSNPPVNFDIGDKFAIEKSYKNEITRAFEEILDWLRTQGYRPALIMDDTQLREVHIALSIAKALHIHGKAERAEYEDYIKKYMKLREGLKLLYDTDETGNPDDADETRPQTTFLR